MKKKPWHYFDGFREIRAYFRSIGADWEHAKKIEEELRYWHRNNPTFEGPEVLCAWQALENREIATMIEWEDQGFDYDLDKMFI